jgi:hypothetical protein
MTKLREVSNADFVSFFSDLVENEDYRICRNVLTDWIEYYDEYSGSILGRKATDWDNTEHWLLVEEELNESFSRRRHPSI